MSILERIRDTDVMLDVVDELSRHMGMKGAMDFDKRITIDDESADIAFLEMAETLWIERRNVLQAFYRYYFPHLPKERQWRVTYMTAASFLDRSASSKVAPDII